MDFDSENHPVETSEVVPENAPPVVETATPEPEPQPVRRRKTASSPAVTINIQSWATPIVGIVMLLAGLLLGYYWRPLVDSAAQGSGKPAASSSGTGGSGANPASANLGANPSSTNPAGSPSSTPTLMEFLISETRHFKGDPNAPITIVEFSDYQ